MLTHVVFRSDAFPPYASEADQVNPGRYGKRLAEFIASSLPGQGEAVAEIFPEDWGWVVPIEHPAFSLWIGVGNHEDSPNGFLCFIEPSKPVIRRFPKLWAPIHTAERVSTLQHALDTVLRSHPEIGEITWWTHAQFNAPSGDA